MGVPRLRTKRMLVERPMLQSTFRQGSGLFKAVPTPRRRRHSKAGSGKVNRSRRSCNFRRACDENIADEVNYDGRNRNFHGHVTKL